ncbi:hypothetical protein WMW72_22885 [Paenibacillus filicis]|uniref:Uncharacterized protein n=1 Tax=Paenibacillus filicis TaxID=669464 RepID=A0ABU9DR93_9BACL
MDQNHRSSEAQLKMMNANQNQRMLSAVFENEIQFPILDITHPLFNASIDEQAYHFLEGLQRILTQTSWVLEESHEIDTIYTLFSLKKA